MCLLILTLVVAAAFPIAGVAAAQVGSTTTYAAPGGNRLLLVGERAPQHISLSGVTFDAAGMKRLFAAPVQVNPGSGLSLTDCVVKDGPRTLIIALGDHLSLHRCHVGAFGLLAQPGDHLEQIVVRSGYAAFRHTTFDGSSGAWALLPRTMTGLMLAKSDFGPVELVIDGSTFAGVKALGLHYVVQIGGKYPLTVFIANTKMERGSSGYFGVTAPPGWPVPQIVDGGGNTDLTTGKPVDHTWPKR